MSIEKRLSDIEKKVAEHVARHCPTCGQAIIPPNERIVKFDYERYANLFEEEIKEQATALAKSWAEGAKNEKL